MIFQGAGRCPNGSLVAMRGCITNALFRFVRRFSKRFNDQAAAWLFRAGALELCLVGGGFYQLHA